MEKGASLMGEDLSKPTVRDFLQSGNPCLFLPTVEDAVAESRVKKALEVLSREGRIPTKYGVWKATTGLMTWPDFSARGQGQPGPKDLMQALKFVEDSDKAMVVIFYHVRQYLKTPAVIQHVIDAVNKARTTFSTLVFVGPYLELPPELYDVVTYCDCPLPTRPELETQVSSIYRAYKQDMKYFPNSVDGEKDLFLKASTAAMGLTTLATENACALSLAMDGGINVDLIQRQKEQEIKKSDVIEFVQVQDNLDAVGGFGELKRWMHRRQKAFTDEARNFGLPYPRGILICGLPGTGKSLTAKAVAAFLGLPLLRMDIGKVYASLVGESEHRMREALRVTEAVSPVVLQLDELEKGLAGHQSSGRLDSGVTSRVISTLLVWRQETTAPVFVVGTVNDPSALPAMVYRRGRFDEIFAVDLPTTEERAEIFKIHLEKRKRSVDKFKIGLLAQKSDRFSGAEIESCIEDAMFNAFYEDNDVTTEHIMASIEGTNAQFKEDNEEITALRKWMADKARKVSSSTDDTEEEHKPMGRARLTAIRTRKTKEEVTDGEKQE
jgi:ATP-dependent 26S proteasome regulatory subunit